MKPDAKQMDLEISPIFSRSHCYRNTKSTELSVYVLFRLN